ncbi:MAG: DUF349 domain-containing protein [Gammaproteobacteria bacterium]|nr:DUF349 domain-containing protein [Gammaproteobacteria bacterium]NNC97514.1 DUF349 domain-containing protein [Gammaproteobacteria bacterium]NNM14230.1 DUF349 domain-containing protein [Gammaproteobacteria bacterium]
MLDAFFKPGWQSKSVEKRIESIAELDSSQSDGPAILETLVKQDPDASVRDAALARIEDPGVIFKLSQDHFDTNIRFKAEERFAQLIGHDTKLSENQCRDIVKEHAQTNTSFIKSCPHTALRVELLQELSTEEQVNLLPSIDFSETRAYIAENIQTVKLLEKARKVLKGKDKNAEKIIKAKIDAQRAELKHAEESQETAETLCDTIEYLAGHPEWRDDFSARFNICKRRWDAIDSKPSDYLVQRFDSAFKVVSKKVKLHKDVTEAHKAQDALVKKLHKECARLAKLSLAELAENKSVVSKCLQECRQAWKEQSHITAPDAAHTKAFRTAQESLASVVTFCDLISTQNPDQEKASLSELKLLDKQIDNTLATLHWPAAYPEFTAKHELLQHQEKLRERRGELQLSDSEKLEKLHKRINRLAGSTKRGNLARAKGELSALIKAVSKYTGKDRTALDERLEKATIAIDKMADWKDFATEPKYIELCEAMEKLVGSKKHPDKLAKEISKLQEKWKALGHSESADDHWDRFKAAGDKAYAPCDEFFKQRHATRRKNLEQREQFVLQLKELLSKTDWEGDVDYKNVEKTMRHLSNDWQKIKDVEQKAGQKQWKRLRKVKSAIFEKLDVVYDANIALKNELIEKARGLIDAEVKEDSIKKLQYIQKQWKTVGVTRRKDDQKAWKQFKSATDAVYEKIQGIRKEKRAKEDEHLNGYRDINKQIIKIARTAKDLASADSEFERLQKEYKELPPFPRGLPEKLVEGIAKDHKRACADFNKSRDRIIAKGKSQALDNLAKKASLCAQLEALPADTDDEFIAELTSKLEALEISDNVLRKRFAKRLAAARETDRSKYSEPRKLMCIDLEILLGVDSPAEDKAQRMKIQLERMQSGGIGQARVDKAEALKKMQLDWYCLPGAEAEIQDKLDNRFIQLVKKK